jgi:N6-adenosine-specific RNA methylase IME4
MKRYKCIVIDPPWNQGKTGKRKTRPNQNTSLDYSTMNIDELRALPINNWADENCFLWLWATNSKDKSTKEPVLKMAFDLLAHWDFTFYTMITWNKRTGPCPFGPYQITTEHILFAYKGSAKFKKETMGKMQTFFTSSSSAHSVKPKIFYDEVVKYFDGPRLDVFARQVREGFDGWGDEYGKYDENIRRPLSLLQSLNLIC